MGRAGVDGREEGAPYEILGHPKFQFMTSIHIILIVNGLLSSAINTTTFVQPRQFKGLQIREREKQRGRESDVIELSIDN